MLSRKTRLTTLGAVGFGGYLLVSSLSGAVAGQSVPNEVAAKLRGGLCSSVSKKPCTGGGGIGCSASGTIITAGPNRGSPYGNNPCNSTCGSFWSSLSPCAGS